MNNTAIIILAAGNSSRLGRPKQLLQFNNKKLLQHTIEQAARSGANLVVVVTGANATEIKKNIDQPIQIVENKNWQQGMASSIVLGVKLITEQYPKTENIIIAVCDQPFISADIFTQLEQTQISSAKNIVASAYAGTRGTPVLFTKKYFKTLLKLSGDEGAKIILKNNADDISTVDFPKGEIDIDTEGDYEKLVKRQSK